MQFAVKWQGWKVGKVGATRSAQKEVLPREYWGKGDVDMNEVKVEIFAAGDGVNYPRKGQVGEGRVEWGRGEGKGEEGGG